MGSICVKESETDHARETDPFQYSLEVHPRRERYALPLVMYTPEELVGVFLRKASLRKKWATSSASKDEFVRQSIDEHLKVLLSIIPVKELQLYPDIVRQSMQQVIHWLRGCDNPLLLSYYSQPTLAAKEASIVMQSSPKFLFHYLKLVFKGENLDDVFPAMIVESLKDYLPFGILCSNHFVLFIYHIVLLSCKNTSMRCAICRLVLYVNLICQNSHPHYPRSDLNQTSSDPKHCAKFHGLLTLIYHCLDNGIFCLHKKCWKTAKSSRNSCVRDVIDAVSAQPKSLLQLSRHAVRSSMHDIRVVTDAYSLPLPTILKDYVSMSTMPQAIREMYIDRASKADYDACYVVRKRYKLTIL